MSHSKLKYIIIRPSNASKINTLLPLALERLEDCLAYWLHPAVTYLMCSAEYKLQRKQWVYTFLVSHIV